MVCIQHEQLCACCIGIADRKGEAVFAGLERLDHRVQQTSVRVIKRTDHARAAILHAGNLRSDDCCITLRGEDLGHGTANK